jgi:hypothetical protein
MGDVIISVAITRVRTLRNIVLLKCRPQDLTADVPHWHRSRARIAMRHVAKELRRVRLIKMKGDLETAVSMLQGARAARRGRAAKVSALYV